MVEQSVTLQPGESKAVSFEAVPHEARTYQVSVDGLTGIFKTISPGPTIINPGFESGLKPWAWYTNHSTRCGRESTSKYGAYEGSRCAVIHASTYGRHIIATLTQSIPWRDEYRGLLLPFSAMAKTVHVPATKMFVEIDDGVGVSVSPAYTGNGAWQKLRVTRPLSPNATKLDLILRCKPDPNAGSTFMAFFDSTKLE